MSIAKIRLACEATLAQLLAGKEIAWENDDYKPVNGKEYIAIFLMLAAPENPTLGDQHYRQRGFMQLNLMFPRNAGTGVATQLADSLRDSLHRGLSMTAESVTVVIDRTPEIGTGRTEDARYMVPIRVRFYADIFKGA